MKTARAWPWPDGPFGLSRPARGQFMHHLELFDGVDVDAQVERWLAAGWQAAE